MAQQHQIVLADGRALPSIGFGTYLARPSEACQAAYDALEVGYRLIDTAAVYGNEKQTAEAIAKSLRRPQEVAVERGEIGSTGVSNWCEWHFKELLEEPDLKIRPLVNRIEINPWLQQTEIVHFCEGHGIAVEAYSPLMRERHVDDPKIQKSARKYKKTPALVLIS